MVSRLSVSSSTASCSQSDQITAQRKHGQPMISRRTICPASTQHQLRLIYAPTSKIQLPIANRQSPSAFIRIVNARHDVNRVCTLGEACYCTICSNFALRHVQKKNRLSIFLPPLSDASLRLDLLRTLLHAKREFEASQQPPVNHSPLIMATQVRQHHAHGKQRGSTKACSLTVHTGYVCHCRLSRIMP